MSAVRPLAGWLGPGAVYRGDVRFEGRVRVDGTLYGRVESQDLVELGPAGHIEGDVVAAQVLVAGFVDGSVHASERCTLLESARVRGRLVTPWLDARPGSEVVAEVAVDRGGLSNAAGRGGDRGGNGVG